MKFDSYIYRKIREYYIILIPMLLTYSACTDNFTPPHAASNPIVVQGSIALNESAYIVLSFMFAPDAKIDSSRYFDVINTRAKVTITDGEQTDIMTLKKNASNFPPHYYTSSKIKATAHKTYTIEVIYYDDTLRASTRIPSPVPEFVIMQEPHETDSTQRYIWVQLTDSVPAVQYYRMLAKTSAQKDFVPTYSSVFSIAPQPPFSQRILVEPGVEQLYSPIRKFTFTIGDTVEVEIRKNSVEHYNFWKTVEDENSNIGNPFYTNGSNLPTNIQGGYGLWEGYSYRRQSYAVQ